MAVREIPENKRKLQELPKKFPELFENHPYSKGPDPLYFPFQCCDGWYDLLANLLHVIKGELGRYREVIEIRESILSKGGDPPLPWIAEYFEANPEDPLKGFTIQQVKEKFGGLRFYAQFGDRGSYKGGAVKACQGAIRLAENMSFSICELCGNKGNPQSPNNGQRILAYRKEAKMEEGEYLPGGGYLQTLCEDHHTEKADESIAEHKAYLEKKKG